MKFTVSVYVYNGFILCLSPALCAKQMPKATFKAFILLFSQQPYEVVKIENEFDWPKVIQEASWPKGDLNLDLSGLSAASL